MADPIWRIGTPGMLRDIACPERDVDITSVRFGGVFQGLSGARTMDVTGHRMQYTFEFKWLNEEEYRWLEMLHLRHVRGPFRLISPLKKNRLSPEASSGKVAPGTAYGATIVNGIGSRVYDWPAAAGVGAESTAWTNRTGTSIVRFDDRKKSTVQAGEALVGSLWMKAAANTTVTIVMDWYDRAGAQTGTSVSTSAAVTTSWTRFQVTDTAPSTAYVARLAMYTSNTTNDLFFTAAQLELGSTPTSWELGNAAPTVVVDQLETTSPTFPLTNCKMTLLET